MKPEPDAVARCVALDAQHATSEADRATGSATSAQPVSLKSLANKVLERNRLRNERAMSGEKPRKFQEPEALRIAPPRERNSQPASDPAAEARRQKVLAMLDAHPEAKYAALTDLQAVPGQVLVSLAIRDAGTVDLLIPFEKWDGVLFFEMLDRHTVH